MRAKDLQEKAVHLKNYWRHQLGIKISLSRRSMMAIA